MGLFSIIKLASDYTKAKKFVENKIADKKITLDKLQKAKEKVEKILEALKDIKAQFELLITDAKNIYNKIVERIKELKANEEVK